MLRCHYSRPLTSKQPRCHACARLQVLVTSELHRTESTADPSLFQYHHHFETPWQLVGKTHLSEVRPRCGGQQQRRLLGAPL